MRLKHLWLLIPVSILLTVFQNCSEVRPLSNSETTTGTTSNQINSTPLEQTQKIEVLRSNPLELPFDLLIDLERSELIQKFADGSSTTLCLPNDIRQKIKDFLAAATVCHLPSTAATNVACIFLYTPPHSIIHFDQNDSLRLGEQVSGCAEVFNLCRADIAGYQALIAEAVGSLSSLTAAPCP